MLPRPRLNRNLEEMTPGRTPVPRTPFHPSPLHPNLPHALLDARVMLLKGARRAHVHTALRASPASRGHCVSSAAPASRLVSSRATVASTVRSLGDVDRSRTLGRAFDARNYATSGALYAPTFSHPVEPDAVSVQPAPTAPRPRPSRTLTRSSSPTGTCSPLCERNMLTAMQRRDCVPGHPHCAYARRAHRCRLLGCGRGRAACAHGPYLLPFRATGASKLRSPQADEAYCIGPAPSAESYVRLMLAERAARVLTQRRVAAPHGQDP
jgi:hypothetical protein